MPASTFKSPPFIILSETKEHHPQAGDCNLNNITLYCDCLREGGADQARGPALSCKEFMSDCTEPPAQQDLQTRIANEPIWHIV